MVESAPQFERDLRSANKEWKRGKDSIVKWSYGVRTQEKWWTLNDDAEGSSDTKARPLGKASDL